MAEYRIVVSSSGRGYTAQCRRWWWPFWVAVNTWNYSSSVEDARSWLEKYLSDQEVRRGAGKVVQNLGRWTP